MYNPHGVFIALENVGYAMLGGAFLFLGGALAGGSSRLERAVRWVLTVGGALILAALVLSAAIYRAELDYRFEVMSLCITWLVLIVAGTLLTVVFGGPSRSGAGVRRVHHQRADRAMKGERHPGVPDRSTCPREP